MNVTKQLYQWDTGQKLAGCTGLYVDFPINNEVYRVETADGMCIIPDEFLQTSGSHRVYECMTNNTIRSFAFSVEPRPKPPDYIYTPTERLTFEGLVQKVDDAVADMIRRAESGEFDGYTPIKGKDYFTASEIQQIQNEVSSGAIGDFKSVVDTETESFNNNAESKLTAYNQNDSQKTTAYNTNATKKLNAYNTNANNKLAEFDAHTEQIQTDIGELKSDLINVNNTKADKTDLAKTNLSLNVLWKMNRGQTWDTLESESEAYSVDIPSGSHYASIDKVGGKSVVWNQLVKNGNFADKSWWDTPEVSYSVNNNIATMRATAKYGGLRKTFFDATVNNHVYFATMSVKTSASANDVRFRLNGGYKDIYNVASDNWQTLQGLYKYANADNRYLQVQDLRTSDWDDVLIKDTMCIDLTQMFGSTIADYIYSLEQSQAGAGVAWFKNMFPADYYPYCEPTIISSQTDRVDVMGRNLFDPNILVGEQFDLINGVLKSKKEINNGTAYRVDFPSGSSVSCEFKCPSGMNYRFLFTYEDGTTVQNTAKSTGDWVVMPTVTFSKRVVSINFDYTGASNDVSIRNIQIEKGSIATAYKPYSLQQITTGFPVLNSAGSVYDYIDLNEGKLRQRIGVVDLGTLDWSIYNGKFISVLNPEPLRKTDGNINMLCLKYETGTFGSSASQGDKKIWLSASTSSNTLWVEDSAYTDATTFKTAMSGVMLYYELAEEVITDIGIPTELSDWLTVEAGGSITFHNTDEGKRLLIPNKLSFVRKLDEVSV